MNKKRYPGTAVTYASKVTPGRKVLTVNGTKVTAVVVRITGVQGVKPKHGEWLRFHLANGWSFRVNGRDIVRVFA